MVLVKGFNPSFFVKYLPQMDILQIYGDWNPSGGHQIGETRGKDLADPPEDLFSDLLK